MFRITSPVSPLPHSGSGPRWRHELFDQILRRLTRTICPGLGIGMAYVMGESPVLFKVASHSWLGEWAAALLSKGNYAPDVARSPGWQWVQAAIPRKQRQCLSNEK